eukprot:3163528-Amphidinium_carterae.1
MYPNHPLRTEIVLYPTLVLLLSMMEHVAMSKGDFDSRDHVEERGPWGGRQDGGGHMVHPSDIGSSRFGSVIVHTQIYAHGGSLRKCQRLFTELNVNVYIVESEHFKVDSNAVAALAVALVLAASQLGGKQNERHVEASRSLLVDELRN